MSENNNMSENNTEHRQNFTGGIFNIITWDGAGDRRGMGDDITWEIYYVLRSMDDKSSMNILFEKSRKLRDLYLSENNIDANISDEIERTKHGLEGGRSSGIILMHLKRKQRNRLEQDISTRNKNIRNFVVRSLLSDVM